MSRRSVRANAVVTGAGSGIGRAFAVELAKRGGRLICADLDELTAKETVVLIEQNGGTAMAVACDVSVEDQVRALSDTAEVWLGQTPDLVINNAGIGAGGLPVGEASLDDWKRTLGINLWGVIHGCHVFLPQLREQGRGGIINVASAAGFTAAPEMAAYNVSKAGVVSLSETLEAELSGTDVAVTVLCPTFVRTNIFAGELIDPAAAQLARRIARIVGFSPERVARMTLDAHDRGRLYVMPQPDAKALWRLKRLAPAQYARVAGLIGRIALNPHQKEQS
jgi:short-subunit dehydrogenase